MQIPRSDRFCAAEIANPSPQAAPCTTICLACTLYAPATCLVSPGCNPCPKFKNDDRLTGAKELNLFPNPATNEFILEGVFKDEEICIFDMYGKLVYKTLAESSGVKISLVNFESGVYIVTTANRGKIKLLKN